MDFLVGLASFWGIVWTAIFFGVFSVLTAYERDEFAFFLLMALFAVVWWFYGFAPLAAIVERPGLLIAGLIVYVFAGVTWSLFKWRVYVGDHRADARDEYYKLHAYRSDWVNNNDGPPHKKGDPKPDAPEYSSWLGTKANPLHPVNHRHRLTIWMVWWPFSMISTILGDFAARFWSWILRTFEKTFVAVMRSGVR